MSCLGPAHYSPAIFTSFLRNEMGTGCDGTIGGEGAFVCVVKEERVIVIGYGLFSIDNTCDADGL